MFKAPQEYMIQHPVLGVGKDNNGLFRFERDGIVFSVISSDGMGWDHVSVSINKNRTPTWAEMCMIKDLFWSPEDCVVQFHPPSSEYVNNHPRCLHLWKKQGENFETPPSIMVGVKSMGEICK